MQHLYSRSRLIRTEMFTLVGLMVRANPDYDAQPSEDSAGIAAQAEALLEELHHSMTMPWSEAFGEAMVNGEPPNPWKSAEAMREPIFYGGEAAFSVQNCDFAGEKYAADDGWLIEHKGASIRHQRRLLQPTPEFLERRLVGSSTAFPARRRQAANKSPCPAPPHFRCGTRTRMGSMGGGAADNATPIVTDRTLGRSCRTSGLTT